MDTPASSGLRTSKSEQIHNVCTYCSYCVSYSSASVLGAHPGGVPWRCLLSRTGASDWYIRIEWIHGMDLDISCVVRTVIWESRVKKTPV